jgi:adenylate cyclase class 2
MNESEIKISVSGPEAAREALGRIGAQPRRPRHFEDNVLFDDSRGSLREKGCVLRLRTREPGEALLTYKGPKSIVEGVRSREEIESAVADPVAMARILAGTGFRPVFRYQKYRESYSWRDLEIVVDETPIGAYLELEGPPATIHAAAHALGSRPEDYIVDSYAGLFFSSGRTGDMVFSGK